MDVRYGTDRVGFGWLVVPRVREGVGKIMGKCSKRIT